MPVSGEREVEVVFDRLCAAVRREDVAKQPPADPRGHLDVAQSRDVEVHVLMSDDLLEPPAQLGSKEELDESRCVEDVCQ